MKMMKKISSLIYSCLVSSAVVLLMQIMFYTAVIPDNFYRDKADMGSFTLGAYPNVSVTNGGGAIAASACQKSVYDMTVMLYGVIPIKNVTVRQTEAPALTPSGEAFGLKMLTDGGMVTEYGGVEGLNGFRSPAKEGGILTGDIIISVNGIKTETTVGLSDAVQLDPDKTEVTVVRNGEKLTLTLTPEKSKEDGIYKLGIWTRDSCAGIGTLTYYDKANMTYGGLGHSVCDADTGTLLPLLHGETVPVCINNIVKGVNGRPGELCG